MLIMLNGEAREVADGSTLAGLLGPLGAGCAVAVNGEVVGRRDVADRVLADGDAIEVVTAVAGG